MPAYVSLVLLAVLAELGIILWWFADQNLIAVGHIAGAIFAAIAFILVVGLIGMWDGQRIQRRALEDASIELGVSVGELKTNEELVPRFLHLLSSRYSSVSCCATGYPIYAAQFAPCGIGSDLFSSAESSLSSCGTPSRIVLPRLYMLGGP